MPVTPNPDEHLNLNTIRQLLQVQAKSPNFLSKMNDSYFDSWKTHEVELKKALDLKKISEVLDLLHRIKGLAGMLGFKKIALELQSAEDELSINFETPHRGFVLIDKISHTTELTKISLDNFLNESIRSN